MKQIPIKNIELLKRLDSFATILYQLPHTFRSLPKPDITFATLKTLMADANFVQMQSCLAIDFTPNLLSGGICEDK